MNDISAFAVPGKASVLVGGQFGSEAKGLIAAHIALNLDKKVTSSCDVISTTNAGAQAGHTTILEDGTKFVCYHLPTIGVLSPDAIIYINAGSIIDIELLRHEIMSVSGATHEPLEHIAKRIVIHPHAAVVTALAKEIEVGASGTSRLGSTQKGVGAALAGKIMRQGGTIIRNMADMDAGSLNLHGLPPIAVRSINLNEALSHKTMVLVEVPQGTGLSINASPFFPYCTSRDCWVGSGLHDAGIHPSFLYQSAMVCRTFPIRVGHIYDPVSGERIGDSGPFYEDSRELDWATHFPNVTPEITTVTKRIRRIASWSNHQYRQALYLNRPNKVFITFANYLADPTALAQFDRSIRRINRACEMSPEMIYSWGPKTNEVGTYREAMDWMTVNTYPGFIEKDEG